MFWLEDEEETRLGTSSTFDDEEWKTFDGVQTEAPEQVRLLVTQIVLVYACSAMGEIG